MKSASLRRLRWLCARIIVLIAFLIISCWIGNIFFNAIDPVASQDKNPIFIEDLYIQTLNFKGPASGTVKVQPQATAGTWTLTLPTTAGTANQFLQTDGSGITTWATSSGGGGTPWVSLHTFGRATVTNIPSGLTELSRATGGSYGRGTVDMTNYTSVRLAVDHILVLCAPDGDLYLQYSTDQSTWITIGNETTEGIDCTSALGAKTSPFITIPDGAKADVFVRVVSENGDGVDDPR